MELPFNTVYSQKILSHEEETPVADWPTKRDWVRYAFEELQAAGYHVSSAYTLVKNRDKVNFSYRDNLWRGADMLATGIASFGHVSGVHYQNLPEWPAYVQTLLEQNQLPIGRGAASHSPSVAGPRNDPATETGVPGDRLIFATSSASTFGNIGRNRGRRMSARDGSRGMGDRITLTPEGLLRADGLLPAFFEPEHQGVRYT